MDTVDEIKSKLSIEDLVWDYIELKKAWRNFRGHCPWHQEKTPSFMVNPERQMCWCFWCQKWWDIFNFIEYTENVEFSEALKILAQKTWVELVVKWEWNSSKKKVIQDIHSEVAKYYQKNISANSVEKFFWFRWITTKDISDFKLWYSPKSASKLYSHLIGIWFKSEDILSSWIISASSIWASDYYDRFWWRVIFPINDIHWNVVGFGWRVIEDKWSSAKYINSSDSIIYDKSSILYWMDKARDSIKNKDFAIVVEWYMDVIACHRIWITNTVAASWTAFTQNQARLIKRYTNNIYFCFDNDWAGLNAAIRSIESCTEFDLNMSVIRLIDAKDPDESIKKDQSAFIDAVTHPLNIMDFIFDSSKDNYDLKNVEQKKNFIDYSFDIIRKFKNSIEVQAYINKLSFLTWVKESMLLSDFEIKKKWHRFAKKQEDSPYKPWVKMDMEEYLLWLYVAYDFSRTMIAQNLIFWILSYEPTKDIYNLLKNNYNAKDVLSDLDSNKQNSIWRYEIFASLQNEMSSKSKIEDEIKKTLKNVNLRNIQVQESRLRSKLNDKWQSDQKDLLNRYQEILKLKSKIQQF